MLKHNFLVNGGGENIETEHLKKNTFKTNTHVCENDHDEQIFLAYFYGSPALGRDFLEKQWGYLEKNTQLFLDVFVRIHLILKTKKVEKYKHQYIVVNYYLDVNAFLKDFLANFQLYTIFTSQNSYI